MMIQVFSMRWNVVIGGQIFSKSMRGYRDYHSEFFAKEGILAAIIILSLPFIILFIMNRIVPGFKNMRPADDK